MKCYGPLHKEHKLERLCQVAVNFPGKDGLLTYRIPQGENPQVGDTFRVPLGKRVTYGLILGQGLRSEKDSFVVKDLHEKLEVYPRLDEKELALFRWISSYYHYPLGKLVYDFFPKELKKKHTVKSLRGRGGEAPFSKDLFSKEIADVRAQFNQFHQFLLHGVTGSGKSFFLLRVIQEIMAQGKSVQYLVPEINLTPQFAQLFQDYLMADIYLFHSSISASQKLAIWNRAASDEGPALFLGVRSSLLLPIKNLGLIAIDEVHDNSFKQQDRCPYHARDVAIKKASLHNIPILMASATPTVETYVKFQTSSLDRSYIRLPHRLGDGKMPTLELLDMKAQKNNTVFHPTSLEVLKDVIRKGEQALIFLNKLGYSQWIQCRNCGVPVKNKSCGCDLNLRFFKRKNRLSCAHCDFSMRPPGECPECGCLDFLPLGVGTEKVFEELLEAIPEIKAARFDRDEVKTFKKLEQTLSDLHEERVNVLVGTQMLAKGHNFKKVNLVIVLGIDAMMQFPDFRANEKTYQLLTQIAGRAGRFGPNGRVLVQTLRPESKVFQFINDGERGQEEFYSVESDLRKQLNLPPFGRIAIVYFHARSLSRLQAESHRVVGDLKQTTKDHELKVEIHGPNPCFIEKKVDRYSWFILLRSQNPGDLHRLLSAFEAGRAKSAEGVATQIDIDPQLMP